MVDRCRITHDTVYSKEMRVRGLAILLMLVTAAWGIADEQFNVRLEANVGFGGLFKPGRWTPVELTVQNLGPGIFGTLRIQIDRRDRFGPDQNTNIFERQLDLATGAVKTYSVILPLETGVYPLRITLVNRGTDVVTQEVKLAGRGASGALVAALSRRTSLDFLLPVFNESGDRALDIVYPLVDYLPDQWQGYDGLDLLVVHDARLQDLTDQQISAVREWVSAGGQLVVSGGAHMGPADRDAVFKLTGLALSTPVVTTVRESGLEDVGLPVVAVEAGQPVVATGFDQQEPAIVVRRLGRGRIVALPFDYAQLVRVAPATSLGLWVSLLPERAVLASGARSEGIVPIAVSRRVFETDILANQLRLPLYSFPSRLLVMGLLGSFAAAVVALLIWLERRKKPTHAGLGAMLLIAASLATAALGHFTLTVRQQPPQALAFSVEIAEMTPDDGYAVVTKDIVLFSRQRADYEIRLPGSPVLIPIEGRDYRVTYERGGQIIDMPASRWSHVNTQVIQVSEMAVQTRIQRGIGYANVEIENDTPVTLDGIVVLNGGFPTNIGRLMPGQTVEQVVMGSGMGRWDQIDWTEFVPAGELVRHRAQLLRDIARDHRDDKAGSLLVVAWNGAPLVEDEIVPDFERRVELSVLLIREPPRVAEVES